MEFLTIATVAEAEELLAARGEEITVMAGGTDVMVQLERGEIKTKALAYIGGLSELDGITRRKGRIEIGTLTCHRHIARSSLLCDGYAALRAAAAQVGGWQTQYAGSIGGNICNASPAADLLAPLLVHDAELMLISRRGRRKITLGEFILGRRKTAREPDELLAGFRLDSVPARTRDAYIKVGRRGGMEVAIVGIAVRLTLEADYETIADVRIATCATGPVPRRAAATEALLQGRRIGAELFQEAGLALLAEISPIDDVRASASYRRGVAPRVLQRALQCCADSIMHKRNAERP